MPTIYKKYMFLCVHKDVDVYVTVRRTLCVLFWSACVACLLRLPYKCALHMCYYYKWYTEYTHAGCPTMRLAIYIKNSDEIACTSLPQSTVMDKPSNPVNSPLKCARFCPWLYCVCMRLTGPFLPLCFWPSWHMKRWNFTVYTCSKKNNIRSTHRRFPKVNERKAV